MDETKLYLTELETELADLKAELKIINKHLSENKTKIDNNYFKDLMVYKDELTKCINEVEIEIELANNELKTNKDGNADNTIN
jgi:hypothetical protein